MRFYDSFHSYHCTYCYSSSIPYFALPIPLFSVLFCSKERGSPVTHSLSTLWYDQNFYETLLFPCCISSVAYPLFSQRSLDRRGQYFVLLVRALSHLSCHLYKTIVQIPLLHFIKTFYLSYIQRRKLFGCYSLPVAICPSRIFQTLLLNIFLVIVYKK